MEKVNWCLLDEKTGYNLRGLRVDSFDSMASSRLQLV